MHIQIIDGEVTYYSPGVPIGSTIESTEELRFLIEELEEIVIEQRTPEQIAVEMAEEGKNEAQRKAREFEDRYQESEDNLSYIIRLFPRWQSEVEYETDDILSFKGRLYRVLQSHTSQNDWTPETSHSLFVDITTRQVGEETGEIPNWEQPDSTNPYNTGDKVIFEGVIYESTIDGNVWSPTDHPQGWKEVAE